jgi:8-oxo-dGTP pyrophosphatase MutT (NUDIX family)
MAAKRWKTLSSKVVHQNPWYKIFQDKVVRPDGKKGEYFVVKTKADAVFVVAVNDRREVCLIDLHRYPTNRFSLEVPAGNSEGQPLLKAAKRELKEETGYEAQSWKKLGSWQSMNGVCREMSHVYLAKNLKKISNKFDRHEGISRVRFVPFRKALGMIVKGQISDGQTIASLFIAGSLLEMIQF